MYIFSHVYTYLHAHTNMYTSQWWVLKITLWWPWTKINSYELKTFNYLLPVLSLCFFLSLSLTCQVNTLVCTILLWSNECPSPQCFFYTSSGRPKFAYVTNPILPETRHMTYKLHSQWRSHFCFSILPVLYTQDTFTPFLNFEVLFTNPSARAGYDTRSIFKRSLTGLNSEFSFS